MGVTKPVESMETKLLRISKLSGEDPKAEFKWLMPHFSKGSLTRCFNELPGWKAVGIAGKTKGLLTTCDYNVLKEIYSDLSTCIIGKYYPYTIYELRNALGINFYNYTGIPGSLWEYPKFHLFITIMQRTVKKNLNIMEAGYSLVRRRADT